MTAVRVGRLSRLIDAVAIALLVTGAGVFGRALVGMRELRDAPHTEFVPGETVAFERVQRYVRLQRLSNVGLLMGALGIVVGFSAAGHAYAIGRRKPSDPPPS